MNNNIFSEITPDIIRLAKKSEAADIIDTELFTRYDVKRGLRDLNGKGVLAGLTIYRMFVLRKPSTVKRIRHMADYFIVVTMLRT